MPDAPPPPTDAPKPNPFDDWANGDESANPDAWLNFLATWFHNYYAHLIKAGFTDSQAMSLVTNCHTLYLSIILPQIMGKK